MHVTSFDSRLKCQLHVCANYLSFGRFRWRQEIACDFLDACLFGHSIFFTIKIFLSVASDFSFQHFNVGKLDCD